MRRIRRIKVFVCTTCFRVFSTSGAARTHAAEHPPERSGSAKGPRRTQAGEILEAVRGGAKTARAIEERTGIPLARVHSLLSYHRARGDVTGPSGKLRARS